MSGIFEYVPHPHAEKRKEAGPPTVAAAVAQLHGPGPIGRLNARIGLRITVVVGTMWCAYLFTLLALVSAPSAFRTGNTIIMVAWIAQTFLQLVLLPIIIVGQNVKPPPPTLAPRPHTTMRPPFWKRPSRSRPISLPRTPRSRRSS